MFFKRVSGQNARTRQLIYSCRSAKQLRNIVLALIRDRGGLHKCRGDFGKPRIAYPTKKTPTAHLYDVVRSHFGWGVFVLALIHARGGRHMCNVFCHVAPVRYRAAAALARQEGSPHKTDSVLVNMMYVDDD